MRLARSRYSQPALLDTPAMLIFGEAISAQDDGPRLEGQQQRVETLMADGFWHTLPQLQKELRRKYGQLYSETSISARLRGMRRRGWTITHNRTQPGSGLYQYRATKGSEAAQ